MLLWFSSHVTYETVWINIYEVQNNVFNNVYAVSSSGVSFRCFDSVLIRFSLFLRSSVLSDFEMIERNLIVIGDFHFLFQRKETRIIANAFAPSCRIVNYSEFDQAITWNLICTRYCTPAYEYLFERCNFLPWR